MTRKSLMLVLVLVLVAGVAGGVWLYRGSDRESGSAVAPLTVVDPGDSSVLGVFEGRIPCAGCERVKVRLILRQDPATKKPTTYVLERINVGEGDARHITNGTWEVSRGTQVDPGATVYRLSAEAPDGFRFYQAVDANILLFLDEDMRLKVGDASHGFTLSKT